MPGAASYGFATLSLLGHIAMITTDIQPTSLDISVARVLNSRSGGCALDSDYANQVASVS